MKMSAIIVAAAALGAVASPVFAAAPAQSHVKATYDAKRDKYCVSQQATGQNIPMRDCRTKAQWAAVGAVVGQQEDAKKAQATTLAQN